MKTTLNFWAEQEYYALRNEDMIRVNNHNPTRRVAQSSNGNEFFDFSSGLVVVKAIDRQYCIFELNYRRNAGRAQKSQALYVQNV
ncbi:MAG: hypothetical protein JRN15_22110 [Nitrososphaerota archaeon]|nr:hypothetical protein [Nitrososphaerota archaeon]